MRKLTATKHISSMNKLLIFLESVLFFVLVSVSYTSAQAYERIGTIELKRDYIIRLGPAGVDGTVTGSIPLEVHICGPEDEFELRGTGTITSTIALGGGCRCEGGGQANVSFKGYLFEPCEIRVVWFEGGGETISCTCPPGVGGEGPHEVPFPLHPVAPFSLEIKDGDTYSADRDWPPYYKMTSEFTLRLDVPTNALNRMLVLRRLVNNPTVDPRWTADEHTIDHIELPWQGWHFLSHNLVDLRKKFASICRDRQEPFSYMLNAIDGATHNLLNYFDLQDKQHTLSAGREIIWDWIQRRQFDPKSVWYAWGGGDQCKPFSTATSLPWLPWLLLDD